MAPGPLPPNGCVPIPTSGRKDSLLPSDRVDPAPPNDGDARKPPRGSQRGRWNPTKQSSFDQHSRLCVATERLSNWRYGFSVGINALERRLDGSEAGAAERPSADAASPYRQTAASRCQGAAVRSNQRPPAPAGSLLVAGDVSFQPAGRELPDARVGPASSSVEPYALGHAKPPPSAAHR
jgi:hypothetical protein